MTIQQTIIAACVLAVIAVPLGTFTTIKLIKKLTRPPVNSLERSGVIELDYIEPTRPEGIYNYPDLTGYQIYDRVPSYWSGPVPSYQSGTLPSYHSVVRGFINSCLEENINLDLILWLIILIIIILLIRKLMISNKIMILLLFILLLSTIYIQFGLLVFMQILIGLIVFFTSNFLSGINPFNLEYRIIRILSIILIIYILWYNSIEIAIHTSVLLPLSIDKIDYLKILNRFVKIEEKLEEKRLLIFDLYKISDFVNNLEDDNNYIVFIEFHPSMQYNILDAPQLIITEPFLINKFSSPTTIITHIQSRLFYMADYFYMDDTLVTENYGESGPFILIKYVKFYDI